VPLAPWRIRWGEADNLAAMRRHFRCGACDRKSCVFIEPHVDREGVDPFPVGRELTIGGERKPDETWPERDARLRAEYLARFPSGDALGEFRDSEPYESSATPPAPPSLQKSCKTRRSPKMWPN
jgi:hypothetical protein